MNRDLLEKLEADYPELRFKESDRFVFRPPKTILFDSSTNSPDLLILHEIAHAILGHRDFKMDVQRLKMESDAWEKARELAMHYGIEVDEELIQTELDSYRDWLHQKSRCPDCGLTRFQTPDSRYHCPRCESLI